MVTVSPTRLPHLFAALDTDESGALEAKEAPAWLSCDQRAESMTQDRFEARVATLVKRGAIDPDVVKDAERNAAGVNAEASMPARSFGERVADFFSGVGKGIAAVLLSPFAVWFGYGRLVLRVLYTQAGDDLHDAFESQRGKSERATTEVSTTLSSAYKCAAMPEIR